MQCDMERCRRGGVEGGEGTHGYLSCLRGATLLSCSTQRTGKRPGTLNREITEPAATTRDNRKVVNCIQMDKRQLSQKEARFYKYKEWNRGSLSDVGGVT